MRRRDFLGCAAAAPALAAWPGLADAKRPDLAKVPTRKANPIEVLYKAPHGHPNGLEVTPEGLWLIDQSGDNWISLIDPANGRLIREFTPHNIRAASGLCVDADGTMWIGSTYNRLMVHLDPRSGRTIAAYQTPGAGLIYRMEGDAAGYRTPLPNAYPEPAAPPANALPGNVARLPDGQVTLDRLEAPPGTGAHSPLAKGDELWIAVPPARMVFIVNKKTWIVRDRFDSAGNRPHDMTWADAAKTRIWASDSNLNAFFLTDAETGAISERIQLPDNSPVIHGAKLLNGYMYCCDDVGLIFRFRM